MASQSRAIPSGFNYEGIAREIRAETKRLREREREREDMSIYVRAINT